MAVRSFTYFKNLFKRGYKIKEQDYADLMDTIDAAASGTLSSNEVMPIGEENIDEDGNYINDDLMGKTIKRMFIGRSRLETKYYSHADNKITFLEPDGEDSKWTIDVGQEIDFEFAL